MLDFILLIECNLNINVQVFGGDDRIGGLTKKVEHNDVINIGKLKVNCLSTPCHTSGHICYFIEPEIGPPVVFTGILIFSTLFCIYLCY